MSKSVAFVTGFPESLLATRVVRELLARGPATEVVCLVSESAAPDAGQGLAELDAPTRARLELLTGDVAAMDFGLSGAEFTALAARVTEIHHGAGRPSGAGARALAPRRIVQSTEEALELADACAELERLVLWSTAAVAGRRRGFILEDDLEDAAGFHSPEEEACFRSERLVRRAMEKRPATILRPSIVVGDSKTGEIDRPDGLYRILNLMLGTPRDVAIPLPSRADIPLNIVPVDFVARAGVALAAHPRSVGRTLHLVDPDPLTVRRVFELLAAAAGRPAPRVVLPAGLTTALLRAPGVERLTHGPRLLVEQLTTEVVYDDRHARALLDDVGISCPPFGSYVDVIVRSAMARHAEGRAVDRGEAPDTSDPLA